MNVISSYPPVYVIIIIYLNQEHNTPGDNLKLHLFTLQACEIFRAYLV